MLDDLKTGLPRLQPSHQGDPTSFQRLKQVLLTQRELVEISARSHVMTESGIQRTADLLFLRESDHGGSARGQSAKDPPGLSKRILRKPRIAHDDPR